MTSPKGVAGSSRAAPPGLAAVNFAHHLAAATDDAGRVHVLTMAHGRLGSLPTSRHVLSNPPAHALFDDPLAAIHELSDRVAAWMLAGSNPPPPQDLLIGILAVGSSSHPMTNNTAASMLEPQTVADLASRSAGKVLMLLEDMWHGDASLRLSPDATVALLANRPGLLDWSNLSGAQLRRVSSARADSLEPLESVREQALSSCPAPRTLQRFNWEYDSIKTVARVLPSPLLVYCILHNCTIPSCAVEDLAALVSHVGRDDADPAFAQPMWEGLKGSIRNISRLENASGVNYVAAELGDLAPVREVLSCLGPLPSEALASLQQHDPTLDGGQMLDEWLTQYSSSRAVAGGSSPHIGDRLHSSALKFLPILALDSRLALVQHWLTKDPRLVLAAPGPELWAAHCLTDLNGVAAENLDEVASFAMEYTTDFDPRTWERLLAGRVAPGATADFTTTLASLPSDSLRERFEAAAAIL